MFSFEPPDKQEFACGGDGRGLTTTSLMSLPILQTAPIYLQTLAENHTSRSSGDRGVRHQVQVASLSGTTMGCDRLTGSEPLGSPSSASAIFGQRPYGTLQHKGSTVTQSVKTSRQMSPLEDRRRSIDGGVRVTGGPFRGLRQDDAEDDVRSELSAFPPSYQMYHAI